jgi:hypothetical protein
MRFGREKSSGFHWSLYLAAFLVIMAILLFGISKILESTQQNSLSHSIVSSVGVPIQHIETFGFDDTEVNADVAVINFRVSVSAQGANESVARAEFLRVIHDIEAQCNEREIPFQIIPKQKQPFVFVQAVDAPMQHMANSQMMQNMLPNSPVSYSNPPPKTKLWSVSQDFSLPLLMSRSPPIPLFLETLAKNGALISTVDFPISEERKTSSEKTSLLKAVADAKSKASFLAVQQNKSVGNILQITPVKVDITEVRDPNIDLLMGQIHEKQQQYQDQLKFQQQQRLQEMNPSPLGSNPYLSNHFSFMQQQQAQLLGLGVPPPAPTSILTSPNMEPLRVFGSHLVDKKVKIRTQVSVKFEAKPLVS